MSSNDSFSVRMGITKPKAMQVDDLDEGARMALFNTVDPLLPEDNCDFSDEEIHAIEQASASPFDNANNHITKAIALFADRQKPDYANSIKESISAVESLVTGITGQGNFDKAIAQLKESGVRLHPQFEAAIKNMYRFTSEPLQCNQATARYMLIICSAMVNFIVASKP